MKSSNRGDPKVTAPTSSSWPQTAPGSASGKEEQPAGEKKSHESSSGDSPAFGEIVMRAIERRQQRKEMNDSMPQPVSRPLTKEEEDWRRAEAEEYVRVMRKESFKTLPLVQMIEESKVPFGIPLNQPQHAKRPLGFKSSKESAELILQCFGEHGNQFFGERQGTAKPTAVSRKGRMARIASEMASLAKDLPVEHGSAVFLRVDEDRPDVMKALITGPEDTPYECGLFEFDILLPEDYPHSPPLVHFATTGGGRVRFNPNLYQTERCAHEYYGDICGVVSFEQDGKVCLSLLGTWPGPSWQADGTSTLLQVLVSIQGLIMVAQPYFNEPGFDCMKGTRHGNDVARQYNAGIRSSTLKVAMLEHSVNPSEVFCHVIQQHFLHKQRSILRQCDIWELLAKEDAEKADSIAKEESSKPKGPFAYKPKGPFAVPSVSSSVFGGGSSKVKGAIAVGGSSSKDLLPSAKDKFLETFRRSCKEVQLKDSSEAGGEEKLEPGKALSGNSGANGPRHWLDKLPCAVDGKMFASDGLFAHWSADEVEVDKGKLSTPKSMHHIAFSSPSAKSTTAKSTFQGSAATSHQEKSSQDESKFLRQTFGRDDFEGSVLKHFQGGGTSNPFDVSSFEKKSVASGLSNGHKTFLTFPVPDFLAFAEIQPPSKVVSIAGKGTKDAGGEGASNSSMKIASETKNGDPAPKTKLPSHAAKIEALKAKTQALKASLEKVKNLSESHKNSSLGAGASKSKFQSSSSAEVLEEITSSIGAVWDTLPVFPVWKKTYQTLAQEVTQTCGNLREELKRRIGIPSISLPPSGMTTSQVPVDGEGMGSSMCGAMAKVSTEKDSDTVKCSKEIVHLVDADVSLKFESSTKRKSQRKKAEFDETDKGGKIGGTRLLPADDRDVQLHNKKRGIAGTDATNVKSPSRHGKRLCRR